MNKKVCGTEDEHLELVCSIVSGVPEESMTWYKGQSVVKTGGPGKIHYAFIPTKLDHGQTFSCVVQNELLKKKNIEQKSDKSFNGSKYLNLCSSCKKYMVNGMYVCEAKNGISDIVGNDFISGYIYYSWTVKHPLFNRSNLVLDQYIQTNCSFILK